MSGHSKWSTIKRHKGVADARRSSLFTKLGHAITIAAHDGADPTMNFKLRLAIDRARAFSLPKENIERAIARGSGAEDGTTLEEVTYEAYGPGGVAIIISALTDNKNRTTADVRSALNAHGASLASAGSVRWLFAPKGRVRIAREALAAIGENLELSLIDAGAEDITTTVEGTTITSPLGALEPIRRVLKTNGVSVADADSELVPANVVSLSPDQVRALERLEEELDDIGEIQRIATNAADPVRDRVSNGADSA